MNNKSLFRQEALSSIKNKNYGTVFINTPVSYIMLTAGCGGLVICLILFLVFAEYSEKYIVTGYINVRKGMASVYPKRQGLIVKQYIEQGAHVVKGDALFLVDTSEDGLDVHHKHKILHRLQNSKRVLEEEIAHKTQHLKALKPLLLKKYIATTTYEAQNDEIKALEHKRNQLMLDIILHKQSRAFVVRAPIDGVVSSVLYQAGQNVHSSKPLVQILPLPIDLIALLYVPVGKAGFLNPNDVITIRYDAYPYQQFGTAKGTIRDISQNVLTDDDEEKPFRVGHPYYKATVLLEEQAIVLSGKARPLQHGMTLSAIVDGPRRKIWQWVVSPSPKEVGVSHGS